VTVAAYVPVDLVEVRAWDRPVGAVALDPNLGCYAFEYFPEWVDTGAQLSPLVVPNQLGTFVFPQLDRATFHGLPGLLADALPDAFGNAVIDAWLTAQNIDKRRITTLDRLAYAGERALGALTFHPPVQALDTPATAIQIADIVTQARDVIAGKIADADSTHHSLRQLIQVGSSAGGARAKAVILLNPSTDQVRSGYAQPEPGFEPWIMKLDGVSAAADGAVNSLDAPQQYTRIEYAYYLMARTAGVEMSESRLLLEGPRAHFLTRRFDRDENGVRIHMQSLCAIDHLDFRYKNAHSYAQYFAVIRRLGINGGAIAQAYRRMVFNVAAMNRDDHTKNLSFLLPQDGGWRLSPAFDVTHAFNPSGEWTQHHQMSINGKFDAVTLADLYAVADAQGVPGSRRITDEVVAAVRAWPDFAAEAGVDPRTIQSISDQMADHTLVTERRQAGRAGTRRARQGVETA
jgi:serine/threonine-protein kinase HipA